MNIYLMAMHVLKDRDSHFDRISCHQCDIFMLVVIFIAQLFV